MTAPSDDADLRRRWRDLVELRLPEAARQRRDWPVRLDHCFARILLDNACGGPWRETVAPPAWATIPAGRLADAVALGEAVLEDRADLTLLNRRSLVFRRKAVALPSPACLRDRDLVLRRWSLGDDGRFAALNADSEVMRFFPETKAARESVAEARRYDRRFEADGFGPWAVEIAGEGFVGFVGPMRIMRAMPFGGGDHPGTMIEMAWRLARSGWGRGIAVRAARLALADVFGRCRVPAVVAFTAMCNEPSRRLMERLGMTWSEEFSHPVLPAGHRLQPHVIYRLTAADFGAASGSMVA